MTSAAVRPLFQKRALARSSDPWHRCGTAPPRSTAIRLGDQRIAALSTQRTITFGPKGRPSGSPSGRGSESRHAPVSGEVNCFRFSARAATSLTLLHQALSSSATAGTLIHRALLSLLDMHLGAQAGRTCSARIRGRPRSAPRRRSACDASLAMSRCATHAWAKTRFRSRAGVRPTSCRHLLEAGPARRL
jgi:hypothetical protein